MLAATTQSSLHCILLLFPLILISYASGTDQNVNCGAVLEGPQGVIHTPNFPGPYPTPIRCEWLIKAPRPGMKILIYFTQFYMTDSFYLTEYDLYLDENTYGGRQDLGRISWEHDLPSIAAYKRYVLIQFNVLTISGNRHLRVIDHLLEVYGFNITYEIVNETAEVTKHTCTVKECSYLGNCIVSADFAKYECQCFEDFFGDNCEYGPYCDPDQGINQCVNGGRCKYFFGSLINQCECPPGFAGSYCEIRSSGEPERHKACEKLNCSDLCEVDEQGAYCSCYDGYKMEENNGTCIAIARYRMDVEMEFQKFVSVPRTNIKQRLSEMKNQLLTTMTEKGLSTITRMTVFGIRNTTITTVLDFFFYIKVSEVTHVTQALQAVVDLGTLANFPLKQSRPLLDQNPELVLIKVANYDPNPTLRGKLLTLVCVAKGSDNIEFRWFKDGNTLDIGLTTRNVWESKIPHTAQDVLLSVLNIDNVGPLDEGEFTCEVEDFGSVRWGNVEVSVNDYPRVELNRMSLSVQEQQQTSIKCFSPDDYSWHVFKYEWLKNGELIGPESSNEYTERMFPTGVRLVVRHVTEYTVYTCRVTNDAGPAEVSAYVYVYSKNGTERLLCPRDYEGSVMWHETSGGHFDIQQCPTEHGGFARRNCECNRQTEVCSWDKPNFAQCQSLVLVKIFDELHLLINGYQKMDLKTIFEELYNFAHPSTPKVIYSGDINMVASILRDLIQHMNTFPQLIVKNSRTDKRIQAQKLVQLMSAILLKSSSSTPNEKAHIKVGTTLVHIVTTLFKGAIKSLDYDPQKAVMSDAVVMRVKSSETVVPPTQSPISAMRKRRNTDKLPDKQDVVEFKLKHLVDLLMYRQSPKRKIKLKADEIVSDVVSVAPYHPDIRQKTSPNVKVTVDHTRTVDVSSVNTTVCLAWYVDPDNLSTGEWKRDGCTVLQSVSTKTVCSCKLPGHFVAAIVKSNRTAPVTNNDHPSIHIPLLISYIAALIILVFILAIYIKTFSQLVGEAYAIHVNFVVSLFCAAVTSIVCLLHLIPQQSAVVPRSVLILFYLVAFTCLLVDAFHVFIITFDIRQITVTRLKYTLVVWGFPLIYFIPMFVVFRRAEDQSCCHILCWLSLDMRQFYAFTFPLSLLLLAFIICCALCVWKLRHMTEEWRFADKKKCMRSLGQSAILFVVLAVSLFLNLNLKSWSQHAQTAAHVFCFIITCLLILLIRIFSDKHIRFLIAQINLKVFGRKSTLKNVKSSSSFRSFVKPEVMSNGASQEEYNVSKYYDEVDRTKYTKERKRQLSALLGSAAGSTEGSSYTKSSTVNSSNESSKEAEVTGMAIFRISDEIECDTNDDGKDDEVFTHPKDDKPENAIKSDTSGHIKQTEALNTQLHSGKNGIRKTAPKLSMEKSNCETQNNTNEEIVRQNSPTRLKSNGLHDKRKNGVIASAKDDSHHVLTENEPSVFPQTDSDVQTNGLNNESHVVTNSMVILKTDSDTQANGLNHESQGVTNATVHDCPQHLNLNDTIHTADVNLTSSTCVNNDNEEERSEPGNYSGLVDQSQGDLGDTDESITSTQPLLLAETS